VARSIILLSGPVASGKTTLGEHLVKRFGFRCFKTRELIRSLLGTELDRRALQEAGERLDRSRGGEWVAAALGQLAGELPEDAMVVVDAVRTVGQTDAIRKAFGKMVTHVHLCAPKPVLAGRYRRRSRKGALRELASYAQVLKSATERRIGELERVADVVIDTNRDRAGDVVVRVAAELGLYGRCVERLVDVVVGGQFGSEGKGHIVSHLAPEYDVLVRVGGPNAGHKVYLEPEPFTFHHLPSGTLHNDHAKLVLGPGAVLGLSKLYEEIAKCEIPTDRLSIDPQAMIIEPHDEAFEAGTLVKSIGSTGQGVGSATARKVLRTAASPNVRLAKDVAELRHYVRPTHQLLEDAFARGSRVLLEGTQGTGLSLHHGFYPHVTSRDTTVSGCLAEAGIAPLRVRRVLMVCRTYPIRVQSPKGASSGPMSKDLKWAEIARRSKLPLEKLLSSERTSTTNRRRRVGEFDWDLLRKAASLNAPTDIALTFTDYISSANRNARRFEQLTQETIRFVHEIERVAGAAVSLIATRFHSRSIIDRRAW
jgi:adenylosuccinate synthase